MKKPTEQEIKDKYESMLKENNTYTPWDALNVGINFMFQYNLEQRDILKVYDIGFEVDIIEIVNILEQNHHLWSDYCPSNFEKISNIIDSDDSLTIIVDLTYEHMILPNGLTIVIDSLARVHVDLSDTPWEGSGAEDELEEVIMSYVVKQRYK